MIYKYICGENITGLSGGPCGEKSVSSTSEIKQISDFFEFLENI